MKIFFHFSVIGFSNSYVIGNDSGGDAVIVDPGIMDIDLLKLVEDNGYYIKHVLLTHRHAAHVGGIKTIMKIYEPEVYANNMSVLDIPVHAVNGGDCMDLNGIKIEAVHVPGHSSDSLVYKIGLALFTGDVLMCGKIGTTTSELARSLLLRSIAEKLYPLDESCLIFPGHGPPSTLKAEKMFNPDLLTGIRHLYS